jgi:hypothetical protein
MQWIVAAGIVFFPLGPQREPVAETFSSLFFPTFSMTALPTITPLGSSAPGSIIPTCSASPSLHFDGMATRRINPA